MPRPRCGRTGAGATLAAAHVRRSSEARNALEAFNELDADVITFETSSSGGADLEATGKIIKDKKISIGVIDHHTLQVESPEEVANQIRRALAPISPPIG